MHIKNFQEIQSWQKARELTISVYKEFGGIRDFGFRDQITRASVSIMNNIAEGFGRDNNKEFVRFLTFSKASATEVQSMILLSLDLKYIEQASFDNLMNLSYDTINLISGFIHYLKKTPKLPNSSTPKLPNFKKNEKTQNIHRSRNPS